MSDPTFCFNRKYSRGKENANIFFYLINSTTDGKKQKKNWMIDQFILD